MRQNKNGDPAVRHLTFKLIGPNGKLLEKPTRWTAPNKQYYTPATIEKTIKQVCDYAEEKYPTLEFRLVELPGHQWNIIAEGEKPIVQHSFQQQSSKDRGGVVQAPAPERSEIHPASFSSGTEESSNGAGASVRLHQGSGILPNDRPSERSEKEPVSEAPVEHSPAPEAAQKNAQHKLKYEFEDDGAAWDVICDHFNNNRGVISPKTIYFKPTEEMWAAISYLCDEWDYAFSGDGATKQ